MCTRPAASPGAGRDGTPRESWQRLEGTGHMHTGRPLRILHLEDDRDDAELVDAELAAAGIACEIARVDTVGAFVKELEGGGVDVVLSDFSMPSFNGLAALTIARERWPDVPFLFISGTIGEERAIEALKLG